MSKTLSQVDPRMRPPRRQTSARTSIGRRLTGSISLAFIGAAAGTLYAKYTLTQEDQSSMMAMYACMGAVLLILAVRMASLFRHILSDFFAKDSDPDS